MIVSLDSAKRTPRPSAEGYGLSFGLLQGLVVRTGSAVSGKANPDHFLETDTVKQHTVPGCRLRLDKIVGGVGQPLGGLKISGHYLHLLWRHHGVSQTFCA